MARAKREGEYHHGDLRRALVDEAIHQLRRGDARALSLRDLARRVGVSTAAPYRHFGSRDALLAAVAEEGFRGLAAEIRAALAELPADDPVRRLGAAGVAYVRYAHRHPSHYRVMFGEELVDRAPFPDLRAAAADSMGQLTEIIAAGLATGRLVGHDARALALAAWSVVHGLASLIGSGQVAVLGFDPKDADALAEGVTAALLSGVVPRAS